MKRYFVLLLFIFATLSHATYAQECMGVPLKVGSGYELTNYDAKGKEDSKTLLIIKDAKKQGQGWLIEMSIQNTDKKNKELYTGMYKMLCTGDELLVDANSFMGEEQRKMFDSFEMKFKSKDISYPARLSVGQTLPNGSLDGEGSAGPMSVTMGMTMTDRKVVSKEKLTTPAGTFDTFKVTNKMNITTKTVMSMAFDFETVSYRAPGLLWDVKSETYRKGKLVSSSVLSKIF